MAWREKNAVAEITHCPAVGGDSVALILAGDIGQVRVVENHCGAKSQVRENEKQTAQPPQISRYEEEQNGHAGPQGGEDLHHLFAQMGVVRNGTENREEENLQPHRN